VSTMIEERNGVGRTARLSGLVGPRQEPDGGLFGTSRRVAHTHPVLVDSLFALALLTFSTLWLVNSPFVGRNAAVLQTALIVPLVWRRVQPSGIFVVISGVAFVQYLLGYQLIGDAALLVALYTVAVHETRIRSACAVGVLEVGAVMAAIKWEPAGTLPRSLLFLSATVVAALFAGLTVASGSRYLLWLAERAERLETERDQQATIAATAERTRIAREMHDIVSHSLSVVITLADGASVVSETDPVRAAKVMAQVSEVGRQALADMRAMIGVLRTNESAADLAPQPDLAQLSVLIDRIRATGLAVEFHTEGLVFPVGGAVELSIYRVIQEALTNTLKHAHARRASVTIRYGHSKVDVRVVDNGDAALEGPVLGHGIGGMRERVAIHQGTLHAGPVAEGGWAVAASFPVNAHQVPL
jgi:signal transduction histidine kinase